MEVVMGKWLDPGNMVFPDYTHIYHIYIYIVI